MAGKGFLLFDYIKFIFCPYRLICFNSKDIAFIRAADLFMLNFH